MVDNKTQITKRKEWLKSQDFGVLQSTKEFKLFEDLVNNSLYLQNDIVEYILKQSYEDRDTPFSYEDLDLRYYRDEDILRDIKEELYNLIDDSKGIAHRDDFNEQVGEILNKDVDTKAVDDLIKEVLDYSQYFICEEDYENLNLFVLSVLSMDYNDYEDMHEIFQWFLVTDDRLLIQLDKFGEPILNNEYWGRCAFGQAIVMDYVFIQIFKNWFIETYMCEFDEVQ